jgi:hypothetical protein
VLGPEGIGVLVGTTVATIPSVVDVGVWRPMVGTGVDISVGAYVNVGVASSPPNPNRLKSSSQDIVAIARKATNKAILNMRAFEVDNEFLVI